MVDLYQRRLDETRARSLESNREIYRQRSSEDRETGVVERVIEEQEKAERKENEEKCEKIMNEYWDNQ